MEEKFYFDGEYFYMPAGAAHFLLGFTIAFEANVDISTEIQVLLQTTEVRAVYTVQRMMTQQQSDAEAKRLLTQSRGCTEVFL
ncbi:MAG: hypothetical protein WCK98_06100 [bacterium]